MPLSVGDKLGHYEVLFGKVLKLDFVRAIFYMAKESLKDRIESGPIFGLDHSRRMEDDCRMFRYHQYCPVARACEILADRWTLLIVRELLFGSRHFNDLRRGLPRISRSPRPAASLS